MEWHYPTMPKTVRIGFIQLDEICYQWVQASPADGDFTWLRRYR